MPEIGKDEFTRIRMMGGSGSYILLPVLTTTQRDALTAETGMQIYNSTTGQVEEYNGSTWRSVGQGILTTHAADLDAHHFGLLQEYRTGQYITAPYSREGANRIVEVNTLYACPIFISRKMTFDRIAIHVKTAGAAGVLAYLGIYNNGANDYPGTLLLDAGTILTDATGVRAISISQAITVPGWHWAVQLHNGTPYVVWNRMVSPLGTADATEGFEYPSTGWEVAQAYGALPATFTAGGSLKAAANITALRVASLD